MEIDFHYHCIGVLAKAAGFREDDALTIAHASQYLDNATESEPIQVGDMIFDPVRTAHYGLKSYDWSTQKRIFIPFHFIPPRPFDPTEHTFVTEPNSIFAQMIWREAEKEQGELSRLCRMGIAIHGFSDTWAHQGFSGRRNRENDVEDIRIRRGQRWRHLKLENIYLDLLPSIGHAEAGYFPDKAYLTWRCDRGQPKETIERSNTETFLTAADTIYKLLRGVEKSNSDPHTPWEAISDKIRGLLADPEEKSSKRCDMWREAFRFLLSPEKFVYESKKWREEALEPKNPEDIDWDDFQPSDFRRLRFSMRPGFYTTPWVQFHRVALKQRHFVLENLL
jgi:hypothetical protein